MARACLFFAIVGLLAGFAQRGSAEAVHLVRNADLAEQFVAAELLTDIYARAGLAADIIPMPPRRASMLAQHGEVEGEVARIALYAKKHPELLKVTPAFYHLTTTVFSKSSDVISSREQLAKYRVGAIVGVAHSDAATEGLPRVEFARDAESLFRMLEGGRIDVAIDTALNGRFIIQKLGLSDIRVAGELDSYDLYNILGPKKAPIARRVSKVITSMRASGELAALEEKYERDFTSHYAPRLASQHELHACFTDFPPFTTLIDKHPTGISIEIFREAARRKGFSTDFVEMPWQRCLNAVRRKIYDVAVDGHQRNNMLNFPTATLIDHLVVFVPADSPIKSYEGPVQFEGKSVSKILSWLANDPLSDDPNILFQDFPDERAQLKALARHQQDAAYGYYSNMTLRAKELGLAIRPLAGCGKTLPSEACP